MHPSRIVIVAAIALTVLAAIAWALIPSPLQVEVGRITQGTFVQSVDDDGIVRVRERYQISAPVAGEMLRPEVKVGDAVRAGQVLATLVPRAPELLDPRTHAELRARREAAEARLARARALVRQSDAALRQSQIDVRRLEELLPQGYVSRIDRDRAVLERDLRAQELDAARFEADAAAHDAEQARAAVARLDAARDDGRAMAAAWPLRAPVSGRVLEVLQESGGPVAVGATLLALGDIERLEAAVDVLSSDATRVRPGARVHLTAGEGVRFAGRVRTVEPTARTHISALGIEEQRVNVVVDMTGPVPPSVGNGYRIDAEIETARIERTLLVPNAALFREGPDWVVYAVRGGIAHATRIEIGLQGKDESVLKAGLQQHDLVILYPGEQVSDRRRVTFHAPRPPQPR